MRILIQKVKKASVSIEGEIFSKIEQGLLVFVGIEDADTAEDLSWLCSKIVHIRLFEDEAGIMNKSVLDMKGDIMLVSQFTLQASTKAGNRPSYLRASKPEHAFPLYESMIQHLSSLLGKQIATGKFGSHMHIELINDGPTTIWIDSKNKE